MSGIQNAFGFMRSAGVSAGSQSYTTSGSYTWVAPTGVTSISVVVVGGGGNAQPGNCCCGTIRAGYGGAGGSLAYTNNYSVTPGSSYGLKVATACGSASYFINGCALNAKSGNNTSPGISSGTLKSGGGNGGWGGCGGFSYAGGGGGAGGYSGAGGNGGFYAGRSPASGTGGGGGGGGYGTSPNRGGGGGGGVGVFGQGSNGAGGCSANPATGGYGGSSGARGSSAGVPYGNVGGAGGLYGGGGGGPGYGICPASYPSGLSGAVRIVWPGNTRQFPSTCVGSP